MNSGVAMSSNDNLLKTTTNMSEDDTITYDIVTSQWGGVEVLP